MFLKSAFDLGVDFDEPFTSLCEVFFSLTCRLLGINGTCNRLLACRVGSIDEVEVVGDFFGGGALIATEIVWSSSIFIWSVALSAFWAASPSSNST